MTHQLGRWVTEVAQSEFKIGRYETWAATLVDYPKLLESSLAVTPLSSPSTWVYAPTAPPQAIDSYRLFRSDEGQ